MASVGSLAAELTLSSVGFTAGLAEAGTGLRGFAASVTGTLGGIMGSFGTLGDVLKGSFDYLKKGVDDVAAVGKEARRLGVSTEFLSTIQFAAGKDAEGLERNLRHLEQTIGKAAQGTEEGTKKFEEWGLSVKELSKMSEEQKILAFVSKFNELGQDKKQAFSREFFGRDATSIQTLADHLKGGVEGAAALADLHGMFVSTGDAAKAMEASRAIHEIGTTFEGLQRTIAVGLAPIIIDLAKRFEEWLASVGGVRGALLIVVDMGTDFLSYLLQGVSDLSDAVMGISTSFAPMVGMAMEVAGWMKVAADYANQMKPTENQPAWMSALKAGLGPLAGLIPGTGAGAPGTADPVKDLMQDWLDKLAKFKAAAHQQLGPRGQDWLANLFGIKGEETPDTLTGIGHYDLPMGLNVSRLAGRFAQLTMGSPEPAHAPGALLAGSVEAHAAEVAYERGGASDKQQQMLDALNAIKAIGKVITDQFQGIKAADD